MYKVNIETIETERTKYTFYCDNCNKYLGESIENADGYAMEYGEYRESIFIKHAENENGEWYKIKKNLCDECTKKLAKEVISKLIELGFEVET